MSSSKINIDWFTVLLYMILALVGWLAVYTANYDANAPSILDTSQSYGRQLIWIGVSCLAAFVIQIFDTRFYTAFAYLIYVVVLLLLIAVLLTGAEISGSRSWFQFGGINLQPSELAKFATCLALARFLSTLNVNIQERRNQLIAAGIIFLPILLIFLQGDAGSAVVFSALILVMYREGLSGGWLALGVLLVVLFVLSLLYPIIPVIIGIATLGLLGIIRQKGIQNQTWAWFLGIVTIVLGATFSLNSIVGLTILSVAALLFLILALQTERLLFTLLAVVFSCSIYVNGVNYAFNNLLKPHQQNRIGVVLGTIEDKRGVGYNLNQSKIAIGSGGIWGKGFLQGTQNKGKFVPELSTDFIFCTIGEEFGFAGTFGLISLFLILLLRVIHLAERQRSDFSRVYGYGVAAIIFFHFFVNIGMTIGMVPVIGIPLPFISYGGSGLLGFTILLFVLVKLDSERLMYLR